MISRPLCIFLAILLTLTPGASWSTFTPSAHRRLHSYSNQSPLTRETPLYERQFSDYQRQRARSFLEMGLRGKRIRREKRKAMREPTPPQIQTPYGPVRMNRPPRVCDMCRGRGMLRCTVCEGRGVIRSTGQRKTNPIQPDRLVGSLWTSVEVYQGHRHHTVMESRGSRRKENLEVRMRNCCGEQQDFWISANQIRNKMVWRMGWQTLQAILKADGGPLRDARVCFLCKGKMVVECVDCDGKGTIPNYEPLHD